MKKDLAKGYSYKDIKDQEERWEIIDGVPYLLASPSYEHQYVMGELHLQLAAFIKNKDCMLILAPFDVQLDTEQTEDNSKFTVQPDLLVVCDKHKITKNRVKGAPDLVIEVLSASTGIKDRNHKYNAYEKYGVKEYWLVDPSNRTIEVLGLEDGKYQKRKVFGPEDTLTSILYPDLQLPLSEILTA